MNATRPRLDVRAGLARDIARARAAVAKISDDGKDAEFPTDERLAEFRESLNEARNLLLSAELRLHDLMFMPVRSA